MIPESRKAITKKAVLNRARGKSTDGGAVRTRTPENP
jgi:hypothetical protein